MPLHRLQKLTEGIMLVMFLLCISLLIIFSNQGVLSDVLEATSMIAALSVALALLAAVASMVASYAFVFFLQDRKLRNLILANIGGVMIPIALLYLMTHVGFPYVTPFPPMDYKNDVISIVAGITISLGLLSTVLAKERSVSTQGLFLVVIFGTALVTYVVFMIALFPSSFLPDWILINNIGLVVGIVVYASDFIIILYFIRNWKARTNSILTGLTLAITTFAIGSTVLITEIEPNQMTELVSIFMIGVSYFFLALPMMATSITEPHRGLSAIVRERTQELLQARDESSFYLNIWTHEVGNILQGILMYLETLELLQSASPEIVKQIIPARILTDRATQTIRQVAEIAAMKENAIELHTVNVASAIDEVIKIVKTHYIASGVRISHVQINQKITVLADAMFSDLISKLISNVIEKSENQHLTIRIMVLEISSKIHIDIRDNGQPLSDLVRQYLTGETAVLQTEIGLDLFIVRNLLRRYRGRISFEKMGSTNENLTLLRFDSKMK
ncbi:MAG: sensor histidine kinase [Candidatus Thorarchaeota archaeon]